MFLLTKYDSSWIFLLLSIFVPYLAFLVSRLVAPSHEGPERLTSYESGIEPKGETWIRFQIRYYMFALVFAIFDVETVFLYPWAMSFKEIGPLAFLEVLIFLFILVLGLVYAWQKGALEWS
uniref:NADH dehydrogenase subunit 3 n=1 Tax=Crepidomanes latealatum TaxID=164669 RepID=UPI0023D88878|nr:NADH dehydrogenase subunit 3 [Crepidomanes latealatum]WDE75863.1 NADH dehydrogenase subunit 3 [Crepidomanes latealatum]